MKKILCSVLCLAMCLAVFAGCGGGRDEEISSEESRVQSGGGAAGNAVPGSSGGSGGFGENAGGEVRYDDEVYRDSSYYYDVWYYEGTNDNFTIEIFADDTFEVVTAGGELVLDGFIEASDENEGGVSLYTEDLDYLGELYEIDWDTMGYYREERDYFIRSSAIIYSLAESEQEKISLGFGPHLYRT